MDLSTTVAKALQITFAEIIALVLAFLGFIGTVSMLIMNLRVTAAMDKVKLEIAQHVGKVELEISQFRLSSAEKQGHLQLEIASMRLEFSKDASNLYQTITNTLQASYVNRKEVEQMHTANTQLLASNTSAIDNLTKRILRLEESIPTA